MAVHHWRCTFLPAGRQVCFFGACPDDYRETSKKEKMNFLDNQYSSMFFWLEPKEPPPD